MNKEDLTQKIDSLKLNAYEKKEIINQLQGQLAQIYFEIGKISEQIEHLKDIK